MLIASLPAITICGFANSVNMIAGFDGLASGVLFICLTSLGTILFAASDVLMDKLYFVLGRTLIGFFIINYSFGKIFLGDGNAYLFVVSGGGNITHARFDTANSNEKFLLLNGLVNLPENISDIEIRF